jgi:lysine-specific demethylase 8
LFPPSTKDALYISLKHPHTNTSLIPDPPERYDASRFPLFNAALQHADAKVAVVNGGDTLLIPEGWWHCIEAVGNGGSVSINHWFR